MTRKEIASSVAANIKLALYMRKCTLDDLVRETGISKRILYSYMYSERSPERPNMEKIAKCLGISAEQLSGCNKDAVDPHDVELTRAAADVLTEIGAFQATYRWLLGCRDSCGSSIRNLVANFASKYRLSEKDTVKIARGESSILNIANLIHDGISKQEICGCESQD